MKLQQSTLLLETRVCEVEGHIGIEITLPQVEDDSDKDD